MLMIIKVLLFLNIALVSIANDFGNKDIVKAKLVEMVKADQSLRLKVNFSSPDKDLFDEIKKVDIENVNTLKEFLKIYNWITISEFGQEADNNAWLLVQHADHDLCFQKSVLEKLEQLYKTKKTNPKHYAYLYDRVAKAEGKPQKYGTQGDVIDDKFVLYEVEDHLNLDNLRASVGLEPINNYIETLKKVLKLK